MNAPKAMQLEIDDIEFIRQAEGVVLSIYCDNPDPGPDGPGCSVEVLDDWGGRWIERRFDGDTFAQALHDARVACEENRKQTTVAGSQEPVAGCEAPSPPPCPENVTRTDLGWF